MGMKQTIIAGVVAGVLVLVIQRTLIPPHRGATQNTPRSYTA